MTTIDERLTMRLPVRVVGIVRGRDVDASADLSLDHDALVLDWADAAAWRLALDGIEGIAAGASSLTVYLRDHDVLELTGSEALRPFALAVMDRACRMPELTRGLKALGAPRYGAYGASVLQSAHDTWFAPLLAARKAVHGVSDPQRQAALMDGGALSTALTESAARIAALVAPDNAAEQRAIEAAIEDEAAELFAALGVLKAAGETVRTGEMDTRLADWRRWVTAVGAVFAAADEAWGGIAGIVGDS
jgi:hypothetical protein